MISLFSSGLTCYDPKIQQMFVSLAEMSISTFASFSIAPAYHVYHSARGHISTGSRCAEITRASEREKRGCGGSRRAKKKCRESVVHVPVTHGTFCPNSARTYFHAARAFTSLQANSDERQTRLTWTVPFFFVYLIESYIRHI